MCRLNGVRRVTPAVAGYQKFEAACFETGGKLTATFHPVDAGERFPATATCPFHTDLSFSAYVSL